MAIDPNRSSRRRPEALEKSVEVLNSYLRGEISAVETYQMASEQDHRAEPPRRARRDACARTRSG